MKITTLLIFAVFGLFSPVFGQDTLVLDGSRKLLNTSVANQFTIYESKSDISSTRFLTSKNKSLKPKKLKNSIENLDFTSSTFFIHFVIVNQTDKSKDLLLETARPITNGISLEDMSNGTVQYSGDGVPFNQKAISSNRSVLPIELKPNSSGEYILKITSDGEVVTLPIIFWEGEYFEQQDRGQQFTFGIFYGIFLFVILIYLTFYVLLRDRLFLLYTVYVLFSGLLQFGLDGYLHQYIFTSGGYFTQHMVVFIAGSTAVLALMYATQYLALTGRTRTIARSFTGLVFVAVMLSLIPGAIYKISFPLINGLSFLAIILLLVTTIRIRKNNPKISRLFIVGLSSLLIGAIIFILGNFSIINAPDITQNSLKTGTLIEILCLSILMAGKYKTLQDEKEQAQKQLLVELEEKNKLAQETNIRLEHEVAERTKEIESQRILLKEKNDDFISSITYAERIQSALLSNEQKFKSILPDSFVIYRPKDIVSGDFYWIDKVDPTEEWPKGLIVYATADCTGHGVPGAFVSIICNNLLKTGKVESSVQNPGQALDYVNSEINKTLNSQYGDAQIRDGMDIALCAIDMHNRILHFAGAKNGAYILRGAELIELKGDRKAIGYSHDDDQTGFTTQTIDLKSGDLIYTFSDGIVDQFGGPNLKKFMSKQLKEILISAANEPLNIQQQKIEQAFEAWKGELDQIDDVLLIGVRIG